MSLKIMIVEGDDEFSFFKTFCQKKNIPEFECIKVGGKSEIKPTLRLIKNRRDFDDIETIIIVQDADASHQATIQSLQATLRNLDLPVPDDHLKFSEDNGLKVGFYVMPGDGSAGMLEDLLLQSVEDNPVKLEAEKYIEQLLQLAQTETIVAPRNLPKARLHAYLSGLERHKKNIGLATKASCFNLDSHHLKPLSDFLSDT
ncbi:DUF3226 domain-containing protein [Vibrio sp. EA2]|uniref:DUF3226 domain-containing protein n=1 Tax=Vibrio sp. EA2 TaxID=3079860 RepID=UPI0029491CEC|nr:DUF3226 domain-containing protein [Vibrio sp. EA2]MDV6250154.1 DUF3226 domain-containing protein [Vibrio sp. EA2]